MYSLIQRLGLVAIFCLLTVPMSNSDEKKQQKNFKDENGIHVYGKNKAPLPEGAPKADFVVFSKYGFKLIELEGKKIWAAATEEDFRRAEAKRLKIRPDKVDLETACGMTGVNQCSGGCITPTSACSLMFAPPSGMFPNGFFYCACF